MVERLIVVALVSAFLAGCGEPGASSDPMSPPPAQSEQERMQERGYSAEEAETKAAQPK